MELKYPQCSKALPFDGMFCDGCGYKLSLASQEPIPKAPSFDEKLDKIQRYLPKGLTEKILAQREKFEGERKQVTVMFCDMEGFTQLSERLGPEEAYSIMDQVYEILIHKVHDYEGTLNEMTGDGIMALFGEPIALEDGAQRAIRSSLLIHREMTRFSDKVEQEREGILPIKMRVGIHTGPVVVGSLGNDLRVELKAVGDTVNLASRMEGLAYHYFKSENREKAYQYLKLSGNKATRNYSNWEAFRFYKEAIEVLTKMPETEENEREQIEVPLLMASPMFPLEYPENSLEILQKGEGLSKELGDENSHVTFLSLIGQYYGFKGEDLLLPQKYFEDSFKGPEKIGDIELMPPIAPDLCMVYFWIGECSKIIDVASKVIALLEKTRRQAESFGRGHNVYSMLCAHYGLGMSMLGNFDEGKVFFEKGLDFALKIKDLFALHFF